MNRTIRTITALILILIIAFSAITFCRNIAATARLDITQQRIYTLSEGTKAVLAKLNQPLKLKLYYAKTATLKAPDQIRYYNNYYYFVKALLEEYVRASNAMVQLELIDPRPFSDEEQQALRYGLRRFPITEEENFFFGLVLQTQFGVVKTVPFFSPERQNFVEYDISHLIDTAVTRQKKRIGILSSLAVMGEDISGYMAEVKTDVEEIADVDILLVIHPKELPEKTLFAIDQYVLKGGRAIIFVDPRCFVDDTKDPFGRQTGEPVSNLEPLLSTWGVRMVENTFAGDRALAVPVRIDRNEPLQRLVGYLDLTPECFNKDNVITANLNQVRMLFAGALTEIDIADSNQADDAKPQMIPLVQTTNRGNTWQVEGPWDWIRINPERMMSYFNDGARPVVMGALIKGRLKSAFPDGVEITEDSEENKEENGEKTEEKEITRKLTGLTRSEGDCAVIVFADVDFISDMVAYQNTVFGLKVAVANNSDLIFNALDDLGGSNELIGIRSRGNFQRPFERVEQMRREADKQHAERVADLQAEIKRLEDDLNQVVSSAKKGQEDLVARSVLDKQRELEVKIRETQGDLRQIQKKRYEQIERLGRNLQNINMWSAAAVILVFEILLVIRRSILRRRYVSHASDA